MTEMPNMPGYVKDGIEWLIENFPDTWENRPGGLKDALKKLVEPEKPKFSPLVEKVWKRLDVDMDLPLDPRDRDGQHSICMEKKHLAEALEGICELPEKVTHQMAADFHDSPEPGHMPSLQLLFDNIRKGKYAPK